MWLLDAKPGSTGLVLSLYSESDAKIYEKEVSASFTGFLISSRPELLVRELEHSGLVRRVWTEDWHVPPYYVDKTRIVVFEVGDLRTLRYILREGSSRGLKPVNTFPHPVIYFLYLKKLRPLTKVLVVGGKVEPIAWDPREEDPVINVVRIRVGWGRYIAETRSVTEYFRSLKDLAYWISSRRFHIGVTSKEVYLGLVEENPAVARAAYLWITSGYYGDAEYFEWSRLSYIPLSMMDDISIGKILTTIEALEAMSRKYLVEKGVRRSEAFRPMEDLLIYDRGGVIYQPLPGLYWRVCQVDFRSLYPSIIVKYNISGETVDSPKCSNLLTLGWAPHRICIDREGVVPASIRKLLELKSLYEQLYRETRTEVYEARRSASKWLLVASFGYLGYRNSLFGSVMAHETVTSTSRYLMASARRVAEELGYRVIHSIVDSLFIDGVSSECECTELSKHISRHTGFETKVEAYYSWLYIPRKFSSTQGTANKYLGRLHTGEMKIKGLLCVREDTPPIVRVAQLEAIKILAEAVTPSDLLEAVSRAREVIESYVNKLLKGQIDPDELLLYRNSRKCRYPYVKPLRYAVTGRAPYILYASKKGLTPYYPGISMSPSLSYYLNLLERALMELPHTVDVVSPRGR